MAGGVHHEGSHSVHDSGEAAKTLGYLGQHGTWLRTDQLQAELLLQLPGITGAAGVHFLGLTDCASAGYI